MFVASAAAAPAPMVALATPGAADVTLLECTSGRVLAATTAPHTLVAGPTLAPDGRALYVATGAGDLLRYSLPTLREEARVALAFEATVLAAAGGPDAVVLAGGRGTNPLSAHDPATLAEVHRYRLPATYAVADLHDVPARRRFVIAFADLREVWEIAYGRDAPPVLQGLVHDYRSNEAIPLPGRFTPRRFEVASPTRALIPGPAPYEAARIDDDGALGIVHLDVRREIERPALAAAPRTGRVVPWGAAAQRGLLVVAAGAHAGEVLVALSWQAGLPFDAGAEILALAPAGGGALLASTGTEGVAIRLVDVRRRSIKTLTTRPAADALPLRFVAGTDGCVVLVDRHDRWLAGVIVAP
ncbi:MAG: hypothetical protein IT522_07715 [Burkholderiales bacterium]|nr:hypothetical protein [Burkholderiales bacterium]